MSANNGRFIAAKIERAAKGLPLRVLDLFSGCGGISLGFQSADFEITAAIESDPDAARSHGQNFHPGKPEHAKARDIIKTTPLQLTTELHLGNPALAFDVVVGGPPCQAFARVGRSKLREVAEHPEAFRHDDRARLYLQYLKYVDACAPLAVLMENVPDMLNHGGHNIAEEVCDVLEGKDYVCAYTILNAAHYGVPQMRERMFLVGYHKDLGIKPAFPAATHWIELPPGYEGSRAVALKMLDRNKDGKPAGRYRNPPEPNKDLPKAVTAEEAIGDLPPINARALLKSGALKRGARRFDEPIAYTEPESRTQFATDMRSWTGFAGTDKLADHVIRYLPRDYSLFAILKPGDQYPEAHQRAQARFARIIARLGRKAPAKGTKPWEELYNSIVPPYDPEKFPNKWRKMEKHLPARTLLAHLGKDGYSHIHYDDKQARTISVREAARLQSFPDGFRFSGTMNPAFRQIGNAVPPRLAKVIAVTMADAIAAAVSERMAVGA
ncbi:MAG TPA: DNA cytosine methyltransferase [Bryobacteraceae bacterium]|nr:DNA cytosine methyltransferase [Bryobacteraceae bacterium]